MRNGERTLATTRKKNTTQVYTVASSRVLYSKKKEKSFFFPLSITLRSIVVTYYNIIRARNIKLFSAHPSPGFHQTQRIVILYVFLNFSNTHRQIFIFPCTNNVFFL